jgi:hypothetical protein
MTRAIDTTGCNEDSLAEWAVPVPILVYLVVAGEGNEGCRMAWHNGQESMELLSRLERLRLRRIGGKYSSRPVFSKILTK